MLGFGRLLLADLADGGTVSQPGGLLQNWALLGKLAGSDLLKQVGLAVRRRVLVGNED
jgi:hypothetical protein